MELSKKNSLSTSFLHLTNPEVFDVSPRTGGVLKIRKVRFDNSYTPTNGTASSQRSSGDSSRKYSGDEDKSLIQANIAKDFKVKTAVDVNFSDESVVEAPTKPKFYDSLYMLGIAISTIILMATDNNPIPDEYTQFTTKFLECIKDECGNHPPNVQGILNHIRYLKERSGRDLENEKQTVIRSVTRVRVGSSSCNAPEPELSPAVEETYENTEDAGEAEGPET